MTPAAMMKAAVCRRYGPIDRVRIEQVAVPAPQDDELLVRVRATTVNRTDCGYRAASPFVIRFFSGLRRPKRPILGTEFAGDVVGMGKDVTAFQAGDRIMGWCEGTFGAHAEYMTVKAGRPLTMPIPEGRSYVEAAPSTEGSHYAVSMIHATNLKAGDSILIYGATGAIGSAAVQLAKAKGAKVTAVCGTANLELVKTLGADRVIDYQTEDFTKDRERYDVVYDAVGKYSFLKCRHLLKPKGIYVATDRPLLHAPFMFVPVFAWWLILAGITKLFRGRRQRFGGPSLDTETLQWLREQILSGTFKPVIDRTYPLDQIVEAYRFVETGQKVGNVVIEV
ncbi:MAG: NAD(P)-dependent alcohol dehydrogenase [Acidimicrobiia bacterium]